MDGPGFLRVLVDVVSFAKLSLQDLLLLWVIFALRFAGGGLLDAGGRVLLCGGTAVKVWGLLGDYWVHL